MRTHFSNPEYAKKVALLQTQQLSVFPPAIPYEKPKEKENSYKGEKEDYKSFEVKLNPADEDSEKVEYHLRMYESGTPEQYVIWYKKYVELEKAMPLDTNLKKISVLRTLLKGTALQLFNTTLGESTTAASVRNAINAVALKAFRNDRNAYRRQVNYMRYHLYFTKQNFKAFEGRLKQMNSYLPYFPRRATGRAPEALSDSDLMEIIDQAKPIEYQQKLLENNYDPYDQTLEAYSQYLERLEASAKIEQSLNPKNSREPTTRKRKKDSHSDESSKSSKKMKCKYCGQENPRHSAENCWEKPGNEKPQWKKRKTTNSSKNKESSNMITLSNEQLMMLVQNGMPKNPKSGKRKIKWAPDSDKSDGEMSESAEEAGHMVEKLSLTSDDELSAYMSLHSSKKRKTKQKCTEFVGELLDQHGQLTPVRILFDTGCSASIILRPFVNRISKYKKPSRTKWSTMGGVFETRRKAQIEFKLPEFATNRSIKWAMHVDDRTDPTKAQYDMIIGSDLLTELGIDLSFSKKQVTWDDITIPMKERGTVSDKEATEAIYQLATESSVVKMSEDRHNEIIKIMYAEVDINEYVKTLEHLDKNQQTALANVLDAYSEMYRGSIGTLNIKPVHFELKPGAKPFCTRPFPVPKAYENLTKEECARFEKDGIWYHTIDSTWAAPSFIVPKKTGDVRIVTDFRELNKWIVRKPYPLPKILDILQKMERFKYATAVDLRKGYYHIPLDEETQKVCTTILPWGKYSYKRLPMGIATSPDVFQKAMNDICGDLPYVIAYLDDILILSDQDDSFEDHLTKVKTVFKRLHSMGMKVNLHKTEFFQSKLEYLGYELTPAGIKPQPKKVEAISRILPPRNKRQLRHFLGMVNYYRDIWPKRSHILAPLSALASPKTKWEWKTNHQQAFEEAKRMIQKEALLAYPDFSKIFHVYADASDIQLGGVIMQDNRPLAFYTRKLNQAQSKYSTGEQELLSIVETLKSFESILMGQNIVVHTDHLNLLYRKLASGRLIRWRMIIEEFGPKFEHIQGEKNKVADALSRLEMTPKKYDELDDTTVKRELSYVVQRDIEDETFPMLPKLIRKHQFKDKKLVQLVQNDQNYTLKRVEGTEIIHFKDKIYVPSTLRGRVMDWYHTYLVHPGMTRMLNTMNQTLYWHGISKHIEEYVKTCRTCQFTKKNRLKYGHLPAKKAEVVPWQRVNVDLVGPYTVQTPKQTLKFRAMTMIDPATNWFEISVIQDTSSKEAQRILDSVWLARYPRPQECGFDNGSEFKWLFRELCDNMGITEKPTTEYNPQANAIIERVHQVLGNQLRSFELESRELNKEERTFEPFLTACAYAIRNTYHTTLKATPGQLVFGRDMILPVQFNADWALIAQRKQDVIDNSNRKENRRRKPHTYKVGEKVLLDKPGLLRKMSVPRIGPFVITKVSTNGTVHIAKGAVTQRVNIRRIAPYFERAT